MPTVAGLSRLCLLRIFLNMKDALCGCKQSRNDAWPRSHKPSVPSCRIAFRKVNAVLGELTFPDIHRSEHNKQQLTTATTRWRHELKKKSPLMTRIEC